MTVASPGASQVNSTAALPLTVRRFLGGGGGSALPDAARPVLAVMTTVTSGNGSEPGFRPEVVWVNTTSSASASAPTVTVNI